MLQLAENARFCSMNPFHNAGSMEFKTKLERPRSLKDEVPLTVKNQGEMAAM